MGDYAFVNLTGLTSIIFGDEITSIGVVAFGAAEAFNVSLNSSSGYLSDLTLADVEALTKNEGGGLNFFCIGYCTPDYFFDCYVYSQYFDLAYCPYNRGN